MLWHSKNNDYIYRTNVRFIIMKETKNSILLKAFVVFLRKGYHGTSISDIQKELDIGRASLYHHFANKKELFLAVIDEVYTAMGNTIKKENTANMTIPELIDHLKQKLYDEAGWLKQHRDIGLSDFFMLSAEALRMNPDYAKESRAMHEKALHIWTRALKNSIAKGAVRADIDIIQTAKLFMLVHHGIGVISTGRDLEQSITETQQAYESIYNLIKA